MECPTSTFLVLQETFISACFLLLLSSAYHCRGTASLIHTDSCKSTSYLILEVSKYLNRCTNISTRVVPSSPAGQLIRRYRLYCAAWPVQVVTA